MLQTLKLLLPALIPSWRFFDVIAPSPRIEFTLLGAEEGVLEQWQEFFPRPAHLSLMDMLKRIFWNPHWNESLFLVSCAERIIKDPTDHSSQEILKRIRASLNLNAIDVIQNPYLQFRLVFVIRHGVELQKHITFISPVYRSCGGAVS